MTNPRPITMTLTSEADVHAMWMKIMAEEDFQQRSLWLVFLDGNGVTLPLLVPVDGLPNFPDRRLMRNLGSIVRQVVGDSTPAASVVMLLSRPGAETMTSTDRRWATAILRAVDPHLMRWPVHLATRAGIRMFAPDDLIAAS